MREEIYKKILKNKELMADAVDEHEETEFISTGVIPLNLLFSGHIDGGIPVGKVSQMAAPSQLGKSFVALSSLANAEKGFFGIIIDTENAFDFDWARKIGVDTSPKSLYVIQANMIEEIAKKFLELTDNLTKEERRHTFVVLDSYGALLTSKTFNDVKTGNDVADMTPAKKKNNLAKLIMGQKVTGFIVNHVYDNIGGYGDKIKIPGGRGLEFCTSCIVLGSSIAKDKDSKKEITGSIVTAKTQKSRFGRKYATLKYRLKDNGGLDVFYGLLPDALEHGCVTAPTKGFYVKQGDDKKYREKDIYNMNFWLPVFKNTDFQQFLEEKYSYRSNDLDIAEINIGELT